MRWLLLLGLLHAAAAAVLGVDFGTEFVKSSLVAPNTPFEIVLTPDSQRKDASGLIIKPRDGERMYGSSGISLTSRFPDAALYGVKQMLGVPYDDLRVALFEEIHPGLKLVETDRGSVAFSIGDKSYPVEEVVAMQLNDVLSRATDLVRDKMRSKTAALKDLALSTPGYFGSAQRQALVDAVSLTSADLIGLVSDGVAVALNYANSPAVASRLDSEKQYVVVYDVGAAAASSTLLSLYQETDGTVYVKVEGYSFDYELGGHALTALLREILFQKFEKRLGTNVKRTPKLLNRLWREAERAKQVLSANTEVSVHVESLYEDNDLSVKLSREEFEDVAKEHVQRVIMPLRNSLDGFTGEIDAVVLAGGASRTPFIHAQLSAELGEAKLSKNVNADEANTQGTSLRGVGLSGIFKARKKFVVEDVTTHTYELAITTSGEPRPEIVTIFARGTALDGQSSAELPRDVTELSLLEDGKQIVSWDVQNVASGIDSLYEPGPYSCISKASLNASFTLDQNGVVRMKGIEAVCDSVRTPTTASTGSSVVEQTASASSTDAESSGAEVTSSTAVVSGADGPSSTSLTEDALTASPESESSQSATQSSEVSSSSTIRPKSRRVNARVSWKQAPIGITERAQLRADLRDFDKLDAERKQRGVLHHQLESLVYRIRAIADEEIAPLADSLLEWIDNGAGTVTELKEKLEEAIALHRRAAPEETEPDETVASDNKPRSEVTVDTDSTTTATGDNESTSTMPSSSIEEDSHDEL